MKQLITGAVIIATGALEGYAFFKCGMIAPAAIMDQMLFKSMIVMKLFIAGVGSSMISQGVLDYINPQQFDKSRGMSKQSPGYARAVGGCAVLGVGMALTGSGPTIIPTQLFGGATNGWLVAAGSLFGGALYSFIEPRVFSSNVCPAPGEKLTVDARVGTKYWRLACPIGFAMVAATVGLEAFWPNSYDQERLGNDPSRMWNPILAGMVIGLNQLPLRMLASRGQGGSTSVMNLISILSAGTVCEKYKVSSVTSAAQLLYVWFGTAIGAYFGMQQQIAETGSFTAPQGAEPMRAFLGGAVMIVGARAAMGCTCGHGISGFSELSLQSIAAAMAIFGGGIATAVGLNAAGF